MNREEAIQILRNYDDLVWREENKVTMGMVADAIRMGEDALQSPWKSVKEELPKEIKYESITLQGKKEFTISEQVIVLTSTGNVFMTYLRNGKWNCARYDTDGFDIEVTHWMPIPELPKEDTK